MKIAAVVGARPQFIKAAVVSREIRKNAKVKEVIIHTGQHYDENMSRIFFDELGIPHPDYNLGICGGTHGENTGRMIESIEKVLLKEKPDMVLIYGDTDSTLAGFLATVKLYIPVAHIEAGLRSFNRKMPEEINRIITDHASDLLFAPTETAVRNLLNEKIDKDRVKLVGDVMFDAAIYYGKNVEERSKILSRLDLKPKEYMLLTVHRAENTNEDNLERLKNILQGIADISKDTSVIFPIHPRTKKIIEKIDLNLQNIKAIGPVGYIDMINLEKNAKLIATDSGGIQKEAYFHKVPCIILRDETEWVELAENAFAVLTGAEKEKITDAFRNFKFNDNYDTAKFYGDGKAGEKIAEIVLK